MPGPNWRLVVNLAPAITSANITDATPAGRGLLTAASAAAQLGLLDVLDISANQYGVHPAFVRAYQADGLLLFMLKKLMQQQAAPTPGPARPAAPTLGQVDDKGDTFSFQPTVENPSFAQYKVAGLPQTTGTEWLNTANSYVQNGRVYVRVVGEVPAGGLAVYVGASGNVPDGQVLTNADRFTASSVPTTPGALQVDFSVDNASLSPGDTLGFTAKASGGTAPYQHSVQALNVDTGAVTDLGMATTASYVGTWPSVQPGVYLVTDAVSDAAGASLVSTARRVVVAAPGSGGGALVPATRTRLGGVRVGDGLAVEPDGLLTTEVQLQKVAIWQEVGDYSNRGLKLPVGGFINEAGHLFIRQVDVGQRHFMFGRFYSLAKDSLIQWKPEEYVGQDGNGDVGLARVGPGMLEVNTAVVGDLASLTLLDLVVGNVPTQALNTFSKLANAFAPYLGSGNTVTADNLVIGGSGNTVNGQTSIVAASVATTNSSNLVVAIGLVAATVKNLQPGVATKNLHLKNGTAREAFITLGIGGAGGLVASTSAGAVATPILLRWRGDYDAAAYYDAGDTVNYQGGICTSKISFQGSAQLGFNAANWLNWGISAGQGGGGAGTVKTVNGIAPDANGAVVLPTADVCNISAAKRQQVVGFFGTGQFKAADVLLAGETEHLPYRSIFCDFVKGDTYELLPDFSTQDAQGNATPTWKRT
jgi:hypothetical protein